MALFWSIRFLQFLGKDRSDFQIALGITLGMMLGLIPFATLHWLVLFGALLILRSNFLAAFLSFIFFWAVSFSLATPLESLGFWALSSHKALLPLWTRAYHAPLIPFTAFNHSTVMGGSLVATLLFLPVLLISKNLVHRWREPVHAYWLSTRVQRAYAHYRRFTH